MKIPLVDLKAQYLSLKPEIDRVLKEVLNTSSFILGEEVEKFEKEFAAYCGVKYCLGVNSGTSALHLALLASGIGKGDEVITQPNTFIATAEAISYTGARPVFVDVRPDNYSLDISKIESVITPKTKAILIVHLYGYPADIIALEKIAKKHKLMFFEDAAQAHGVSVKGKKLGSFGKAGCFSFYPGKTLGAYGEGGALITNEKKLFEKAMALRNHGQFEKNNHQLIGYNYRLEGFQGVVLRVKLKKLDYWLEKRRKAAKLYNDSLAGTEVIAPPKEFLDISNFQYYVIRAKKRDDLKDYLIKNGVGAAIHYPTPLHLTEAYRFLGYKKGDFSVAEQHAKEILTLPLYPEITKRQIVYIVNLIKKFYRG